MTRMAQCTCGDTRPSDRALPFFEDRSAGHTDRECRHCFFFFEAHQYDPKRVSPDPLPQTRDHIFEPRTEGHPFDSFYCGHGGWD